MIERLEKRTKRKRRRKPLRRRLKFVVWTDSDNVGLWFCERRQTLRIAGHMKSEEFGKTLLDLARDSARSVGMRRADARAQRDLVGGNRWRLSLRLPGCRGILVLIEKAIRAGRMPGVMIAGPLKSFGRLTY